MVATHLMSHEGLIAVPNLPDFLVPTALHIAFSESNEQRSHQDTLCVITTMRAAARGRIG